MEGIAYNDRQTKDFLKMFIDPLDIWKMGWLNWTVLMKSSVNSPFLFY
jgi:hypothetical protein